MLENCGLWVKKRMNGEGGGGALDGEARGRAGRGRGKRGVERGRANVTAP